MKTIWTMTTVKNEQDIIESFVRYHLNFVDGMLISDNKSSDNTLVILEKLKSEGLNIDLIKDDNAHFDQLAKRNELLQMLIEKYSPDYIFPLDADEFICAKDGTNPREKILKLKENQFYQYLPQNYVLTGNEKQEPFIPKKITHRLIYKEDSYYKHLPKSIIPKGIYKKGINLAMGAHTIFSNNGESIESNIIDDLFWAHFPVRSSEQLMNKVIIGRLNNSSIHRREEGFGFHQYNILDKILEKGNIDSDTLLNESKYYGISDKKEVVGIKNQPINLNFCESLEMKYTDFNSVNVLVSTVKTAESIINHMRDTKIDVEILNEKLNIIDNLKNEQENLNEAYKHLELEKNSILESKIVLDSEKADILKKYVELQSINEILNESNAKLIKENKVRISELEHTNATLQGIYNSRTWSIIDKIKKVLGIFRRK